VYCATARFRALGKKCKKKTYAEDPEDLLIANNYLRVMSDGVADKWENGLTEESDCLSSTFLQG
jgi:hypothetical protein